MAIAKMSPYCPIFFVYICAYNSKSITFLISTKMSIPTKKCQFLGDSKKNCQFLGDYRLSVISLPIR